MKKLFLSSLLLTLVSQAAGASEPYDEKVFDAVDSIQPRVIAWRRDFHQNPELSNRESRTGSVIARHLSELGLHVTEGVVGHGVIGVLRGRGAGRTIVLRADMDALPVEEATNLPFASSATGTWLGETVPVMHACGHDAHVAMLMGAAEVLAGMRNEFSGTVVFLFQPAEEGPPHGERGGAPLIVQEGHLAKFDPDAILGLHVVPGESGKIVWKSGPFMAAADSWSLTVEGQQTHGAMPSLGVDAASVAAEIVTSFNHIVSRQINLAHAPAVLSVGQIQLGARHNIIPGHFEMAGTLRTFDPVMRTAILEKMRRSLVAIELKYGARAELVLEASLPVTANDRDLTRSMANTVSRAANNLVADDVDFVMGSEDFAVYAELAPTFFYHLGIGDSAPNHSPHFVIDESALKTGVRAHVLTALDFFSELSADTLTRRSE